MSQSITIPSADTIRTMIADMESTCNQVLMQYERNIDANPGDGQVEDQADTIRQFQEILRMWEVKFKTDFEPGEDRPTEHQEEARSSLKYMGESNNTSPKAVYVTLYRPQGIRQDPLDPRFDLEKHSPNGFDWGHTSSGAAQLALAILAHNTGNDNYALAYHQDFKRDVISKLPFSAPWTMEEEQVTGWVKDHRLVSPREFQETIR